MNYNLVLTDKHDVSKMFTIRATTDEVTTKTIGDLKRTVLNGLHMNGVDITKIKLYLHYTIGRFNKYLLCDDDNDFIINNIDMAKQNNTFFYEFAPDIATQASITINNNMLSGMQLPPAPSAPPQPLVRTPSLTVAPVPEGTTPFCITGNKDLWNLWQQTGGPISVGGSYMGCGYNVLAFLEIVTREEALNSIRGIVNSGSNGLMIPEMIRHLNEDSRYSQELQGKGLDRNYFFWKDATQQQLLTELCNHLRGQSNGNRFIYTIMKLIIDPVSGLGHSVICEYDFRKNECSVIDAQKNRKTLASKYINYLTEGLGRVYHGFSYITVENIDDYDMLGGKKRKSNKTKKVYKKKMNKKINLYNKYTNKMDNSKTKSNKPKGTKSKANKIIVGGRNNIINLENSDIPDNDLSYMSPKDLAILKKVLDAEDEYFNNLNNNK